MAISKVTLNGDTLMDVTQDTVTANKLLSGETATGADGVGITGTIATKTSSNMTVSGATVTAPAGYYATAASKSVASGSVTQNAPTINSSTGVVTATSTVTAGYVSAGTKSNTLNLTTQAAATITPTTSQQTAVEAGKYTTGAVTVGAIPSQYIVPSGTLSITENGTGIDVTSYASVDVDVSSSGGGGTKYIWTDVDGEGAWDVSGYNLCSVDGAPIKDGHYRVWLTGVTAGVQYEASFTSTLSATKSVTIDWGDGTIETRTSSSTRSHAYQTGGNYVVEFQFTDSSNVGIRYFPQTNNISHVKYLEISHGNSGYSYAPNIQNNSALVKAYICDDITGVNGYGFTGCSSLQSVRLSPAMISVTSNCFSDCTSLVSCPLHEGIQYILTYAFANCVSLKIITFPASLLAIRSNAFQYCSGLKEIHFLGTTPPTVDDSNAWTNLPTDCKIYIPTGTLADYTSATNYPDPATYTYIEE